MLLITSKHPGWGKQKPAQWGPLSAVQAAVRHNCEEFLSVQLESLKICLPFWEKAGLPQNIVGNPPISNTSDWCNEGIDLGTVAQQKFIIFGNSNGSLTSSSKTTLLFHGESNELRNGGDATSLPTFFSDRVISAQSNISFEWRLSRNYQTAADAHHLAWRISNNWAIYDNRTMTIPRNDGFHAFGVSVNYSGGSVVFYQDGDSYVGTKTLNQTSVAPSGYTNNVVVGGITDDLNDNHSGKAGIILKIDEFLSADIHGQFRETPYALLQKYTPPVYIDMGVNLIPSLIYPAQGATSVGQPIPFEWSAVTGATAYQIQIATENTFAAPVVDDATLTTTTKSVSGLADGTQHFWRVKADV